MASTTLAAPASRKPSALRLVLRALPVVAGLLAADIAAAQSREELGRLIFEVAPIPPDGAANTAGTAGAGAEAAAATSQTGDVATAEPANLLPDIIAYRARINDTKATSSPYSTELREQYDALGTLLQQNGQHEEAIEAFEAAMHIDRVNAGLYTLDQIPVVEKIIASHEALGNDAEVDDFHGYLFYIQQKSYPDGDPRLLAAQEEWADWNLESYLKERARVGGGVMFETGSGLGSGVDYVAVQNPRDGTFVYVPRTQLLNVMNPLERGSVFDPLVMQTYGVDAEHVIDERLRTARDYYEDIVEPEDGADDETPASSALGKDDEYRVDRKLADVAYAIRDQIANIDTVGDPGSLYFNNRNSQNIRPPMAVTRGYQNNRDTLEAIAEELAQDPAATAVQKAQAWIDVGDWHVGYDYAQRGEEAYRRAWELLNAAGMDAAAIESIFMPLPLVPAPGFATHRYSREIYGIDPDASIDYKGHMDLTLDVSRYGDVSRIRVDAAVPEPSQSLRSELIDYLRRQKVRPAIVNGEPVERDNVRMRYYYSY